MGVEEIIIQQAEEKGLEKGLKLQLDEVIKKMIIKGKTNQEICDLLEVNESRVVTIRKEIMG